MKQGNTTGKQDPGQIINEAMQAIDVLRDLYTQENDALSRSSVNEFMDLQALKEEPLNIYKDRIEALMMNKEEAKKVDPTLKKKLQTKQADFAALCEHNLKGLKRMQRGTERLSNKIRFLRARSSKTARSS